MLSLALGWAARGSRLWNAITIATLCLTLAAPGPVAGMALVLAYRNVPVVYDFPGMIILAQTFRSLPYAILLLWPFLSSFPQDYLDAAAIDGLDRPRQFLRVVIPLALRPIVAAWAIAFAMGLGELAATNIATPPGVPPVSVVIWGMLHTGVESTLAGVALIVLLVVAVAGLFATAAIWSLRPVKQPTACRMMVGCSYFSGSFGFSPATTALMASLSWSSRCGPPPTKTLATLPSRSMMTVCGIATALYLSATAPSRSRATVTFSF